MIKRPLHKVLGRKIATEAELHTLLTLIEAYINDRSLTYVNSDPQNDTITPSHLIYGRRITPCPTYDPEAEEENTPVPLTADHAKKRLIHLQSIFHEYWKKFNAEYIYLLLEIDTNYPIQPVTVRLSSCRFCT